MRLLSLHYCSRYRRCANFLAIKHDKNEFKAATGKWRIICLGTYEGAVRTAHLLLPFADQAVETSGDLIAPTLQTGHGHKQSRTDISQPAMGGGRTPASSFYVAVTRAKQSVAIVLDDGGASALPFWQPSERVD